MRYCQIPHRREGCECRIRQEDFCINKVIYKILLPYCVERSILFERGPIRAMADVAEELSGYKLIHERELKEFIRDLITPIRIFEIEDRLKDLKPANESRSCYYVIREVLRLLKPWTRCFLCKKRSRRRRELVLFSHPQSESFSDCSKVPICRECIGRWHQQWEDHQRWLREERDKLKNCKKQLRALRLLCAENDREALKSLPPGFGPAISLPC